jgi:hypothetical protein
MENVKKVRYGWLKFMYIYTAIGAGFMGLGMLIIPLTINSVFKMPAEEPVIYGIAGSTFLAFGLVSLLGFRSPLTFIPILFLQMTYKTIWFIGIILPLAIKSQLPTYSVTIILIFATYILGDIIAIPFGRLFSRNRLSSPQ